MDNKQKERASLGSRLAASEAFISVAASLICIVLGLLLGLVALAIINAGHAWNDGLLVIISSGLKSPRNMGTVLANAAPLIMTGLSVGFAFKTGLFNIGAAGQYTLGAFGALYCAIVLQLPWYVCLLAAMVLLMGLRPCVMFFSVDALFMRESLSFYIVRTRTRAHDIILVLAAMLFVNREFAWQFAEKERLAAHLDELVRERTQKLMDMQAQRQSVMLNIFHDIRTPLTVMRGALDVIEASPEAVGTMVPLISSRLRFVTELTGDLFLVAKLEDGQVMLTCARVDLSAVAREQGEQTAQLAREAGVTLETEIEPGLVIWGERLRLSQIAQNLLTNAVHYTPRGGLVRLTLAREGGEAVLRVSDTGKGIAPEDQKHIFDRYFHTTAQTKHESSGLGLTIARELTLLHRGTLSVESELERGTTFIVRFALLDAADEPA